MEQERQVYLFMNDKQHSFCLYRIGEPQVYAGDNNDEASISLLDKPLLDLDKPLLEMDKSTFPDSMSFTAIGSRIFMVGGRFDNCSSNKVFIYDTSSSSSTVVRGPPLNSGKRSPLLFTFGSKIFALSHLMHIKDREDRGQERSPRFEMLDTRVPESKWSPLPLPVLQVSSIRPCYRVSATAAVYVDGRPVIFISARDAGTYAFEVDKLVWNYVGAEILPVFGDAVSIPHAPSMCCGHSLRSDRFAAFRFFYQGNGKGFGFKEIPVYGCENLPPLGPPLVSQRPLPVVFGPDNRVYFISTGVDDSSALGNRYVMVYALDFEGVSLDLNVPRSLKRRRKNKQIGHGEDQDETPEVAVLESLQQMGHDEKQVETAEVVLNKGQSSKSSKKKKEKSRNGNDEEQDETTKVNLSKGWLNKCGNKERRNGNDEEQDKTTKVNLSEVQLLNKCGNKRREMEVEEDTTKEFKLVKLSSIWGECFFGGPAVDSTIHVLAAIAM